VSWSCHNTHRNNDAAMRCITCGSRQVASQTPSMAHRSPSLFERDEQAERDAEDYEGWTEVDFQEACNPNQGAK
jgi:hypothetical protein